MKFRKGLSADINLNMGDFLAKYMAEFIGNYQAKFGRFLSNKQKLQLLYNEVVNLEKEPLKAVQAGTLKISINNALDKQKALEISGADILSFINIIQTDSTIKAVAAGNIPSIIEFEKWAKIQQTYDLSLKTKALATSWFNEVNQLISDTDLYEQKLNNIKSGTGIAIPSGTGWLLPVAAAGIAAYFMFFKKGKR